MHKIWTKAKQLQQMKIFTSYSPIYHNGSYPELTKLQNASKWQICGITHLQHIFKDINLVSFF